MPNKGYPYLEDCKADHRLLGATPLLNPFADHVSSQRGKMFSDHVPQAQVVTGAEHPLVFTGYESQCGDYEIFHYDRDQDGCILAVIPKFNVRSGSRPIMFSPYDLIIYRGAEDNAIHYVKRAKFVRCSEDYGYENKLLNINKVDINSLLSKDDKLTTSPNHDGYKYGIGTNLNTVYMSLPHVTEDAFVISETAAKKLTTWGYCELNIDISPDQIPLNLYGDEENYKFFPDIGETVGDDCVLCAFRKPSVASFIADTNQESLSELQPLHDTIFYTKHPGAEVVDITVHINRNNRNKGFKPDYLFDQCEKYREQHNNHCRQIVDIYQLAKNRGVPISNEFNCLVTDAMRELLIDGQRVEGVNRTGRGSTVTPAEKKKIIEFIRITITYRYERKVQRGFKLTGRYGNKGVITDIWKDEDMPTDQQGFKADIIVDDQSVFNRMNPGQQMEQLIARCAEIVRRNITEVIKTTGDYHRAWDMLIEFENDVNRKFAAKLNQTHPTDELKRGLLNECVAGEMHVNVLPFQKNMTVDHMRFLCNKYNGFKSPVTFTIHNSDGTSKTITTKRPVLVGAENWMLLAKMPHAHGNGVSYVNQCKIPVKGSKLASVQYPMNQTPYRLGEDEIRNIIMFAGPEVAAKILAEYANNPEAVEALTRYLLTNENPGDLKELPGFDTARYIDGNNIIGMLKYKNATFGNDMCPEDM